MDEGIRDELQGMSEDALEDMVDELRDEISGCVEEAVNDSISEIITEALEEFFSSHTIALPDGAVIHPKERLKVLSPDKRKLLPCYGGLKVDGKTLVIQTRISSWQGLCWYDTEEEAVAALLKINDAMQSGENYLEL